MCKWCKSIDNYFVCTQASMKYDLENCVLNCGLFLDWKVDMELIDTACLIGECEFDWERK